ncbi:hypothetical protein DVH05_006793 [Phytophthora capsici]|nr:hypothetical protein DVH05_006793 [Phytophthora capsici]
MAFRARWRKLRKEGWSHKRPSGLSDDFVYLKPGKTKTDVEGEDFFVGEEALMRYLDRCDLGKVFCWQETPPFSTDFVYIPAELEKQNTQDREAYTDSIIAMNHASNGSDGSGVCPEGNG